ncbi:DUF2167 domain-containing protein [Paenibacillus sp. R14(2021)]|uniref:DUF2167 domain-containing protein n=1 Tax=Paenibacillus sp. R14(2021) TaxID=2859228 RepID=UPI001C614E41|nr:DUF2167 domain-containing protein [Paenibacillus sp. R14(2021)]
MNDKRNWPTWLKGAAGTAFILPLLLLQLALPESASAEEAAPAANAANAANAAKLNWVQGAGQKLELGDGLAELTLPKELVFLNKADTMTYETIIGGKPNENEIGSVFPVDEAQQWVVYIEYEESGHVADDEKDAIDADALLDSYKIGTEEANKDLEDANKLYVDSWSVPPHYDEQLHSLSWSLLAHDAGGNKLINHNVRILTREGVVSAILVSDPAHLDADRVTMEKSVLPAFALKSGKRYEDYDASTDKTSKYGLTALILGGGGLLVAKKVGLLAAILLFAKKFWIIVIAGGGALWRFLRGKAAKKKEAAAQAAQEETTTEHVS